MSKDKITVSFDNKEIETDLDDLKQATQDLKSVLQARIEFHRFHVHSIKLKGKTNMTLSFLELRVDEHGIYDITHTQQDWHFRNAAIFDLVDQLNKFVPTAEKELSIQEIEIGVNSWLESEENQQFGIEFEKIKFKFVANGNNITTQKLYLSNLIDNEADNYKEKYEELMTIIEKINVNVYEFCILGTTFEPEEVDSDEIID